MKKIISIFLIFTVCLISGCTSTNGKDSEMEVRGLTSKISLITTASDVYKINVSMPETFSEEMYKKSGEDSLDYYKWAKDTYNSMDDSLKFRLRNIFEIYGEWQFVNETISLEDDASVDEIIESINTSENLTISENLKKDIELFFKCFYKDYFKELIDKNTSKIDQSVKELNELIKENDIDVFSFMEENSGIKFSNNYKALFYYDIVPIGAMGFEYDGNKVSTIQPNTDSNILLRTPFHEYSHELFRSFTLDEEFKKICEELTKDEKLLDSYNSIGRNAYDWVGWCEENLVNGFSEYLSHKYYGKKSKQPIYAYDLEFCNYLIEENFNPKNISLKDISIEFYKNKIDSIK
ncbi:hypothetical protein [Paraclostridium bifermentans]|uniref:hypothetical protein n=1 Tax=Paraclostridium bifermentans TaxID=1490 RepID=UPI00359C9670